MSDGASLQRVFAAGPRREALRDLVAAISLVNLVFWRVWAATFDFGNHYFFHSPPHWSAFAIPVAAVLLLAVVLWAFVRAVRRSGRLAQSLAAVLLLLSLNFLRQQTPLALSPLAERLGTLVTAGAAALIAVATILAVTRYRPVLFKATRLVLLAVSPFAGLMLAKAVYFTAHYAFVPDNAGSFLDDSGKGRGGQRAAIRVLVLVFDAFDQQLAFSERPPGLELPAFDAFRATATSAEQAYPVSNLTAISLPALISGLRVSGASFRGPSDLQLELPSGKRMEWGDAPSLFQEAQSAGMDSSLVGWYHPYCRVLRGQLASCRWFPYLDDPMANPRASAITMLKLLAGGPDPFAVEPSWHAAQYESLQREALHAATDTRASLVFIHYPIPHQPFIYDRSNGFIGARAEASYLDNLALADRAFSELRLALEEAELWDQTSILVSSDHWYRRPGWRERSEYHTVIGKPDHRVPLMVKMAGQETSERFAGVVEHLVLHELALCILRGDVRNQQDVLALLSRRTLAAGPSPRPVLTSRPTAARQ